MSSAYEKKGASCKVQLGNGQFADHHSNLGDGGQGQMPMAATAAMGPQVSSGGGGGWMRIAPGCAWLLAVIFAFILLFVFWYLVFQCLPVSWCCDKKTQKKDCTRVLWSAFVAAFLSLLILWLICYVCGRC